MAARNGLLWPVVFHIANQWLPYRCRVTMAGPVAGSRGGLALTIRSGASDGTLESIHAQIAWRASTVGHDWVQCLFFVLRGGIGHGCNDLALGPDGRIYTIHGDSVTLPTHAVDRTSPLRKLEPEGRTGTGYWVALSADGRNPVLLAVGLRNPYGIACSSDGEWFTCDADAEHDMGAAWYRPTRIRQLLLHLESGGKPRR